MTGIGPRTHGPVNGSLTCGMLTACCWSVVPWVQQWKEEETGPVNAILETQGQHHFAAGDESDILQAWAAPPPGVIIFCMRGWLRLGKPGSLRGGWMVDGACGV